ncbi:hypothetical protein KFK09_005908 [Dendrobium nobile]|uniref:Uncharacterized protein n=1 Tax=Dendrobium nobile TaxID=94219 RepID=A0A8T3C1W1_DENNO|nr:hypothetical protein KFK09_005908 [Dendrobium nobile]
MNSSSSHLQDYLRVPLFGTVEIDEVPQNLDLCLQSENVTGGVLEDPVSVNRLRQCNLVAGGSISDGRDEIF